MPVASGFSILSKSSQNTAIIVKKIHHPEHDIKDAGIINNIKIKSKEEDGWKGNKNVDKRASKEQQNEYIYKGNTFHSQTMGNT